MYILVGDNMIPLLITMLGACLVYILTLAVHRLFFSPIASIPGPKLAAVSFWYVYYPDSFYQATSNSPRYEFYYDVILKGQYTFEIGRMHKLYGPIIRINPLEVHISRPDFYEKLYSGPGKRRNKWSWYTAQFALPQSMFGTDDHDAHRIRRAAVNPFFSKGAVRRLQPVIEDRIEALLERFQQF